MFVNSDFSDLLRIFNANSVEYLVIGGYALIQYAEPRYTKDLDLWISTDSENSSTVFQSLQSFGAPLVEEAWERRETVWFDDLPVLFISRKDLIVVKRASGRPQDLIDADLLS